MVLVPSSPPLQDSPGFLAQCSLPASSLLSPYLILSIRFCSVGHPHPAASGHPLSVRRKSTQLRLTANQCPSPGFLSSVLYECLPPPTCPSGSTWFGCEWRGTLDGTPRNGLELLDASTGVERRSVPLVDALGTSSMLVVPVSL